MLHGRRLDHALEHVSGSRYALVHAVAKRARQITLWLTADPAELRADAAPPPVAGETVTRDPVALAEGEILDGEVIVRWDPDGLAEEPELLDVPLETDPLLLEGLEGDEDDDLDLDAETESLTPALAQVLDTDDSVDDEEDVPEPEADIEAEELLEDDDAIEVSLEDIDEGDDEDEIED
jgi:DNA-directed RNA polymerase subunit K/omega